MISVKGISRISSSRTKIVLETFVLLHTIQFVTGLFLLPFLLQYDLGLPPIAVSGLATTSTSLTLALLYIVIRTKAFPVLIGENTIPASVAGIFLLWMIRVIALVWFDKTNSYARAMLNLEGSAFYLTVLTVTTLGPFLEEILFRGYFFDFLKDELGVLTAAIASALLFVVSHGIWGGFGAQSILYFVDSLVYVFIYTQGGVLATGLCHSFVNAYVLILSK